MSERLQVWMHGLAVGYLLQKDNGNLQFRYHEHYVRDRGPAISLSMPLRTEAYPHRACLAVFGGLLPEQGVRTAAAAALGISEFNDYRLLEALGGDCAGALEFHPDGHIPEQRGTGRIITPEELDEVIDRLPTQPLGIGPSGDARMSLAGAQGKLPVIFDPMQPPMLPAAGGLPSTHIIKPEPARFPGLVHNESFCMNLARALELGVAPVETAVTVSGMPYLVVERFDRDMLSDPVRRLHQEDTCQALGRLPLEKYQAEGGPSVREVAELVRASSAVPARDLARFWDALVFNVLIGNCDAHGKNWSLLYEGRAPSLAPLYDLVATAEYPGLSTRMAMRIGRASHLPDVDVAAWEECALDGRWNATAALTRVRRLADRAVATATRLVQLPAFDNEASRSIATAIEERAERWRA